MPDLDYTIPPLRVDLPTEGMLTPAQINSIVGLAQTQHQIEQENRAAAIRYQGQMEYQQLLGTGMDPSEALRRTLGKISFGSPREFVSGQIGLARARQNAMHETTLEDLARERLNLARQAQRNRESVVPEISTVTDPITGKQHSMARTGPNTFHLIPAAKDSVEQKGLSAIEQRDLLAEQRELLKQKNKAAEEGNTKALPDLDKKLLKNKTAQTNLVMSAIPPMSTNRAMAGPAIPTPDTGIQLQPNEVIRRTRDGQKAVFDKDTKAFLRYAD